MARTEPASPRPRRTVRDWTARPRSTLVEAQRYSRFVALMKRILPAAAAVLIAAVLSYSLLPREQDRVAMTFQSMHSIQNDLAMVKPRLSGSDNKGNPFVITADRAIQLGRGSRRARLENVEADMTVKGQGWVTASAANGLFDAGARSLSLGGGISVYSDSGYELHTKTAQVDLKGGQISGNQAVTGQGPLGTMSADSFHVDRDSQQIFLKGDVHSTFVLKGDGRLRGTPK